MLGGLIDPRAEDEPLHEYKDRLADVAQAMAKRSFTDLPGEPSWREAREQELEGRLGTDVQLVDASDDPDLIEEADDRALTWDNITEREGQIRWPAVEPRGKSARHGVGQAKKGGVATSDALQMRGSGLELEPGYVLVENELWYVPGELRVISLNVPSGTESTVLVPWQIRSQHAHRAEVKSESEVRLVGADGHEHVVEAARGEEPRQVAYNEAGSLRSGHEHEITHVQVRGPVFLQTRPAAPTSNTGGGTLNAVEGSTIAPGRPARVLHLKDVTVQTEPDATGHQHEVQLSPHDYWSGNFTLPTETHTHEVEDRVVQPADGHQHVIDKPAIPESRHLVPRLTRYEGKQLLGEAGSPFVMCG